MFRTFCVSCLLMGAFLFSNQLHGYTYLSAGAAVEMHSYKRGATQWGVGMRYCFGHLGLDAAWRKGAGSSFFKPEGNASHAALLLYLNPSFIFTPYIGGGYGWYRGDVDSKGKPLAFVGLEFGSCLPLHLFAELSFVPDICFERKCPKGVKRFKATAMMVRLGAGLF